MNNSRHHTFLLLLFIICVGAVLRFYNFQDIPFTPDEFSALGRLQFETVGEVIELGIKPDGHPAGVQLFLYYWTALFGTTEMAVKLPFLLMGIGAIYFMFAIGKKWYNETVGLLTATLIATLQFSVMYSQIARPYGSGLFLCLAMVFYWTKVYQETEKFNKWDWLGYILFSALCAYNHHFSLLFTAIVGLTGVVLSKGKTRKWFFLGGLAVFLLYVPHLPIFFAQLHIAGIGSWLQAPTPIFFWNFISYIFHFSWLLASIIALLLCILIIKKGTIDKSNYNWIAVIWFLLPLLIGYFYSVYRAPLLQYSVLIFSFPFLLFFIFGWIKPLSSKWNALLVGLLITLTSASLIGERKHYDVFYYREMFKQNVVAVPELLDTYGKENSEVILANHPEIIAHYFHKYKLDYDFFHFKPNEPNLKELAQLIHDSKSSYIIIGVLDNQPKEIIQLVRYKYPYLIEKRDYIGSNIWVFSKNADHSIPNDYFKKENTFDTIQADWFGYLELEVDSLSHKNYLKVTDENEYSAGTEILLSKEIKHEKDVIEGQLEFEWMDSIKGEVLVVFDIYTASGSKLWRAGSSTSFEVDSSNKQSVFISLDYHILEKISNEDVYLKTYIWNKDKTTLKVTRFSITIREGNREKYAIWEKF